MMGKMLVYHGTDSLFDMIDLDSSKDKRDFGRGFYVTTIPAQAETWARTMRVRHGTQKAYVYVFELDISPACSVCCFEGLTVEWLQMIKENRTTGGVQHSFDIVRGPVADDDTLRTVNRYMDGVYTAEEAINRLKHKEANDQIAFHTPRAVACLRLVRRYEVGE